MTNLLQKNWEWQEGRRLDWEPRKFRYNTLYMASLDVKTTFDVARPSVVSEILTLIGTHGLVVAAILAEMQDVKGIGLLRELRNGVSVFLSLYVRAELRHWFCGVA